MSQLRYPRTHRPSLSGFSDSVLGNGAGVITSTGEELAAGVSTNVLDAVSELGVVGLVSARTISTMNPGEGSFLCIGTKAKHN